MCKCAGHCFVGVNPKLGLPQSSGHTTTQASKAGSPAIDHAPSKFCEAVDQRSCSDRLTATWMARRNAISARTKSSQRWWKANSGGTELAIPRKKGEP